MFDANQALKVSRVFPLPCYHVRMYFFRLKPLKEELAGTGLPEKERMKYLLAFFFLFTMASFLGSNEPTIINYASCAVMLILLITGFLYAFKRNGGNQGHSFLERYLSISWVVNIRVGIIMLFIAGFLGTGLSILGFIDPMEEEGGQGLLLLVMIIGETFMVWNIGKHVGEVRTAAETRLVNIPVVSPEQSIERLDKLVESIVHREVETAVRGARPRRKKRPITRRVSRRK